MYFDGTIGLNDYTVTLRIDGFWFWKPWYVWDNQSQTCYAVSLGFFEIEVRIPNDKPKPRY